ncbi:activator-dependent family glycosyltransferase [Amycolatopsis sp. NPDC005232]|uniref:activator-dependent family glycosyltransferase n=1 Tax=Amycolatopsis sp. NPDC005232 TaxID=3157027 RepID=UPI0033B740A3
MRVLFATHAERSHFYSMVPLAWALRAAGHEVRVVSQPALSGDITAAGLTAVPVGTDHRMAEILKELNTADWSSGLTDSSSALTHDGRIEPDATWAGQGVLYRAFVEYYMRGVNNDSYVDGLVDFARYYRPDLVIWEPFTFAGPVAAKAVGAAHARLVWGPDLLLQMRQVFLRTRADQPSELVADPLETWLKPFLERSGAEFGPDVATGQWTIDPCPAGVRVPLGLDLLPMRYVPYNGPAVVPSWLNADPVKPRVCLTSGMSLREQTGRDALGIADLAAFAELDIELVATIKLGADVDRASIPDNVRVVDFVPMHALLPSCSAIVHFGNGGTWSTALHAGVPQLVIASNWEVLHKAKHLAATGAGACVSDLSELPAALAGMLADPSVAAAAARLRDEEVLSQPSPGEVVAELEKRCAAQAA